MARRRFWWAGLEDEALLDLRFCDLRLSIAHSTLPRHVKRLDGELARRGIRFRPHYWLSEEWFSPDGVPGIAIPFYLAHPRLARLERHFMHEVEGGNARWLMRILRHEAGHALDAAYQVRRRGNWRKVFGPVSRKYPTSYKPRTGSRNFVLHLGHWYAQSHPTEDFAETFAVWLAPNSRWRTEYEAWPAMRKLEYIDALMEDLRGEAPVVSNRMEVDPLEKNRRTLRQHYARRLRYHAGFETSRYDSQLRRVFRAGKPGNPGADGVAAATFIRRVRPQLRRLLIRRARLHPYLVHHVIRLVIQRTRELDLCVAKPDRATERETFSLMEKILFDFVRRGRERFAL